jgi:hypothetical protein
VKRKPLPLHLRDQLLRRAHHLAPRGDVHGEIRRPLELLVLKHLPRRLTQRQRALLVHAQKHNHHLLLARVKPGNHLLLRLGKRRRPRQGRHIAVRGKGEVARVGLHERRELVEEQEAGVRVAEGGLQKGRVGAEKGEAVERAAGEVVCGLGAELLGEEGVLCGEDGELGEGHACWLLRGVVPGIRG